MPIKDVIRQKRKELNLTQEQIAEQLGVSIPAVCKWESGASCPDIALLPALARTLRIDVNTLLCFKQELSDTEIAVLVNKIATTAMHEDYGKAFAMAEEKIREYPGDAQLIHTLAATMQGAMMMVEMTGQQREDYDGKILALYERVGAGGNEEYANRSNYMLAGRAINDGQPERARKLLNRLPDEDLPDKKLLQARLLMEEGRREEAARIYAGRILNAIVNMQMPLTQLIRMAAENDDQENALRLIKCGETMTEIFGLWDYNFYLYSFEKATAEKNADEIIVILDKMLEALMTPWDTDNTPLSPYMGSKKQEQNWGTGMLGSIRAELEKDPQYAFLRENPKFEQLLQKYNQIQPVQSPLS